MYVVEYVHKYYIYRFVFPKKHFRISDKAPAYFTGQSFRHYDTTTGFACVNEDQTQGGCSDYEARQAGKDLNKFCVFAQLVFSLQ